MLFPWIIVLLFTILASFTENSKSAAINGFEGDQRQTISVNPMHLDLFFFRSAVAALFRAKADSMLAPMSPTERIVHHQCEQDADGRLNRLAKCLVTLYNNMRGFGANSNRNWRKAKRGEEADGGTAITEMMTPCCWWWYSLVPNNFMQKFNWTTMEKGRNKKTKKIGEMSAKSKMEKNLARLKELLEKKGEKRREKREQQQMGDKFKQYMQAGEESNKVGEKPKLEQYPNVQKLWRIERFYQMVEKCSEYIRRKDAGLTKFLQSVPLPFRLSTASAERSPLLGMAESQLKGTVRFDKLSILSPKLLSILPEKASNGHLFPQLRQNATNDSNSNLPIDNPLLLSPTLLSFHEQGDFSLPYLLKLAFSNGNETLAWLDLLLQISGTSSTLEKLIETLGPSFEEIEKRIHPAVERLEELERRFRKLEESQSGKQREEIAKKGYTFLSEEQSRMIGLEKEEQNELEEEKTEEEMEELLEEDIRTIAGMDESQLAALNGIPLRQKRQLSQKPYGQVRLLNPYLFAHQLHEGAVFRRVALSSSAFSTSILSPDFARLDLLSPHAFVPTILSPRAAVAEILSPTAFTARILSPEALLTQILSPKVFTARILSPRALSAYVLSPRALVITILSPKMLEARVLSPTALSFTVLSPTIGGTKFASPQSLSMVVLSPSILNPTFLNKGVGNTRILSPTILSGGEQSGGGE